MKTTIAAWSEVAGTYDLDFGKAALNQARQRLKPRGFWGDIGEIGKTVLEGAQGNADYDKSVTFDVDVGEAGKRSNIYTDPQSRFSIDCVDCFITGSWQVEGHIVVRIAIRVHQYRVTGFKLQDLTLSAAPSNFKAKLGLEATVTASKAPESLEESKELFTAGIPGAGIAVKGIFKLGATVSYEVGTSATFAGTATAAFGLEATLPNGAKVVADVNDPSRSSAVGWQRSSLTPSFEITQLSASLTLAAFSQPKISFGIELIEVGNVEIALTMKLPEISSTMSATYDPQGVCAQSAGSSKTGVKLENEATESLSLAIDVDLGDDSRKPSWSKPLLNFSQPLGDECIPLNIPGLAAASGTATSQGPGPTSAAPATCKPPGKTGICQATSKACAGGAYISGYCPGGESVKCCPDADSTPSTTASPPAGATPKTCTPPGKTGICQQTSVTCPGGAYISGYCPGDSSIQCCPAASESTPTTCAPPGKSGICQPTTQTCPGGAYISGYCPGDDSIQCCPAADSTPSAPAPTTCAPPGKTGVCQKTSLSCEGGAYIAGLCPGDDSVKCCPDVVAGEGGGGCKVKRDRVGRRVVIC
ncbi:MAG: hypothetical protein LQ343_004596 [Gyalolechia ehrenbergii]|nr:MAG: hypothetical protein LQ343_004596 [Gyalolechia ehrenbergii]